MSGSILQTFGAKNYTRRISAKPAKIKNDDLVMPEDINDDTTTIHQLHSGKSIDQKKISKFELKQDTYSSNVTSSFKSISLVDSHQPREDIFIAASKKHFDIYQKPRPVPSERPEDKPILQSNQNLPLEDNSPLSSTNNSSIQSDIVPEIISSLTKKIVHNSTLEVPVSELNNARKNADIGIQILSDHINELDNVLQDVENQLEFFNSQVDHINEKSNNISKNARLNEAKVNDLNQWMNLYLSKKNYFHVLIDYLLIVYSIFTAFIWIIWRAFQLHKDNESKK